MSWLGYWKVLVKGILFTFAIDRNSGSRSNIIGISNWNVIGFWFSF